jgi:YHS domain-containing protein
MSVKDPVCGVPLDPEKAEFKVEFLNKQYYFDMSIACTALSKALRSPISPWKSA